MEKQFGSLNLKQLREELKKRNARITGRKSELVERLIAYERNGNFGKCETLEPEYSMVLPDQTLYFDLNSDSKFSGMEMDAIVNYLNQFEKMFDSHVKDIYADNYLAYYRVSRTGDDVYIKSNCDAEMRSGVSYNIDIKLNNNGDVIEAQCECAVGMGPNAHCKHVCTVLFGAVVFKAKKFVNVKETCTQKLQTFHKCSKFTGSPVKSTDLNMAAADEFTNVDFDPRPRELRGIPTYRDYFRNTCLNFRGISKTPLFQLIPPANSFAVAHDHDYLMETPEDNFLHAIKVSKINEESISKIEQLTRGQSNNQIWKEERSKRITSSMFGKICKATDKTDMSKLASTLMKVKNIRAASLEHGRMHEDVAISKYEQLTGNKVRKCGLFVCKEYPFLAASPDGMLNRDTLIEVKCPYTSRNDMISPNTIPYLQLDENNSLYLDRKHDYFFQIQGQLLCTKAKKCVFIICAADKGKVVDTKYMLVERDEQFIEELVSKLELFYKKFFQQALLEKYFYRPIQ